MLERFWARVDDGGGPGGCWPWQGGRTGAGYGALYLGHVGWRGILISAHPFPYELHYRGPIPSDLTVDHLCRVRHCVNPRHLELVSLGENVLRGEAPPAQHARALACLRGHVFDPANTYRMPRGGRACRLCQRTRNRDYARRQRATAKAACAR